MTAVAAGATLLFIVIGGIVGARLLWLARRTRGQPEALLGSGLFLIVGLGYPTSLAANVLGGEAGAGRFLAGLAIVLMAVGWMCVWLFTWRVFRPDATVARATSWSAVASLGLLTVWRLGVVAGDGTIDLARADAPTLGIQILALVVYVWTTCESFGYWARLRRRLALGLADPVVTNRFFVWGIVAGFSFLSLIGPVLAGFAGTNPAEVPAVRLATAVSGLVCCAGLYLAFLPPRSYLRWLSSAAA